MTAKFAPTSSQSYALSRCWGDDSNGGFCRVAAVSPTAAAPF